MRAQAQRLENDSGQTAAHFVIARSQAGWSCTRTGERRSGKRVIQALHLLQAQLNVQRAQIILKLRRYWLAIVPAVFVEFPDEVARAKTATTTPEWPCAFARLRVTPSEFLSTYPCNHIHGVYGDWTDELLSIAHMLGIEARIYC